MAGLLDFVAGFGVGALGGLAEQKKANLEQKRQLNLAKLKAEYAADIETKKKEREIKERTRLAELFRQNPELAREQAFVSGIELPDTSASRPNEIEIAEFLFPGDVESQRKYVLEQKEGSSETSAGLEKISDSVTGLDFYVDKNNKKAYVFRAGQFEEIPNSNMPDVILQATGQAQQGVPTAREPAPPPPAMIARPGLEVQAPPPPTQPSSKATTTAMNQGISENVSKLEEVLGIKINEQDLFDYSSNLAGPIDRSLAFASRLNAIGHVIDFMGFGDTAEQSRQAENASKFLARQMSLAFTHNPEGRQNIQDINIGRELLSGTGLGLMGVITRDKAAYQALLQVRDQLVNMIDTESEIYNSIRAPKQSREKSGMFLANVAPIMPVLDAYIGGYLVSNTGAAPPGQEKPKPVLEWNESDFINLYSIPEEERQSRYNNDQMLALQIWMRDLQRRRAQ